VLQASKLILRDFSVFATDYKMKYAIAMMALIPMLFSATGTAAETSTLEQIKSSKTKTRHSFPYENGSRRSRPLPVFYNKS